jgi:hypothetical protein
MLSHPLTNTDMIKTDRPILQKIRNLQSSKTLVSLHQATRCHIAKVIFTPTAVRTSNLTYMRLKSAFRFNIKTILLKNPNELPVV